MTFYSLSDKRKIMNKKILNQLTSDLKKKSINSMSLKLNIPYATLWRFVNGDGNCNMRTWNKIEKYYSAQRS